MSMSNAEQVDIASTEFVMSPTDGLPRHRKGLRG